MRSPQSVKKKKSPRKLADTLPPGQKGYYTKVMKQMFPVKGKSRLGDGDKRTFYDFTEKQINEAHTYVTDKKKATQKKRKIYLRVQVLKYLNKKGKKHDYTYETLPNDLIKRYEADPKFQEFKKRQGYKIVFRKLKNRKPRDNRELDAFIQKLAEERKKPRKKSPKSNAKFYKRPRTLKSEI